jgi:hypothetical protein
MPTCEFEGCNQEYIRTAPNQRFCKNTECAAIRVKKQTRENSEAFRENNGINDLKKERKDKKARSKPCKNEFCKKRTINYFGYCDDCRSVMLQGTDPGIPLSMYPE